ncbi:hypothetical protein LOZ65_004594 [Ophidiomyces ophidiicola]|nr:hypothetical protein LOZ65_004594 [Ophidiomyces ophidiicola]
MNELRAFLLVAEDDGQEAARLAKITAQKLDTKQSTLTKVVQGLSEYISDESPSIRGKAISYLTAVIQALPSGFLSQQQIEALTVFYCERIEDDGAICGLESLQDSSRFTKNMAKLVARGLFKNTEYFHSRLRSQRFQVLRILNSLMIGYREALLDMSDESLVGIIELVNGERDPRNLMLVFSILKVVIVEWDISHHVQVLFDSVFRYFPVTFRSHQGDSFQMTAQDLKNRLQDCISSNQSFASLAFPSLLDKLDATSLNVKVRFPTLTLELSDSQQKDALNALCACISSYEPAVIAEYSITMWDSLRFEIFNAQDNVFAEESLQTLKILARRLSVNVHGILKQSSLAQYLNPILRECKEQLQEPQQKQAMPAQRVLASLSSASAAAFTLISQSVIPCLFVRYKNFKTPERIHLLETLVDLLDSAVVLFGSWGTIGIDTAFTNPLLDHKANLVEIFTNALAGSEKAESSMRTVAISGMLHLSLLRDFLNNNEVRLYVQKLDDILLVEQLPGSRLKKCVIEALTKISKYKPTLILDITIPAFMSNLPECNNDFGLGCLDILDNLAQIRVEGDVLYILIRHLLSKLDMFVTCESSSARAYPHSLLMTILYALGRKGMGNDIHFSLYYDQIVRHLCERAVFTAMIGSQASFLNTPTALNSLGRLCRLIVRPIPRDKYQEVCRNVYYLYSSQCGFTPVPYSLDPPESLRRTMILSTYLLAGLPKESITTFNATYDMAKLVANLTLLAISESVSSIQSTLVRQLALLVNKFLPPSDLNMVSDLLFSLMPSSKPGGAVTIQRLRTIFWISKALILRLCSATTGILSSLVMLLSHPDLSVREASANGFSLLLSFDDILSVDDGANVRLLTKQRVLNIIIPLISHEMQEITARNKVGFSHERDQGKQAYFSALAGILSTLPSSLILSEISALMPLLLQALDSIGAKSQQIKVATLETLGSIIRDTDLYYLDKTGYLEDLVIRLLRAATITNFDINESAPKKDMLNSSEVRLKATQCIYLLVLPRIFENSNINENTEPSLLLPLRGRVMQSLKSILDDPRRDVRKAAVDAQILWLKHTNGSLRDID